MKLINKSTQNNSGLTYLIFKNFSPYPHLKSAVFTRLGGYSLSPYKSLNMGLQVGDNYNTVILNRKKAINEIGFTFDRLIAMEQIHSDNIKIVKREDGGRGAYEWENGIKETDGMICCDRGVTLMAVVADCPVTLFYDFHNGVMGIAHCGWRGTVKSIGRKLLQNLRSHYNSRPSDIIAGVSPGIDICCYEVGEDVFSAFQNEYGSEGKKFFEYRNKKLYLNLKKAIKFQLLQEGMKKENINFSEFCTSCRKDLFFSHRAEGGKTGRIGVFIGMKT